jgi:regulatory protein
MSSERDATDVALRALRHRDLSRSGLDERLARAGVDADERRETIERLAETGLVSDERYARERARVLAERGAGDDAIRVDLRRHGVERALADSAVEELEPEPDRASRVFARRGGGEQALRYLARKGFGREALEGLESDSLH